MKRILCIVGNMDMGGAETFLMKIYRALDREKYQMDFCVGKKEKGFYEDEIKALGGTIYRVTPKTKGALKNFKDIKNIVKKNNYDNVLRVSQNSLSAMELLAARLGGARNLVFRSSNSSVFGGKKEEIVHYMFRPFANKISNQKIAPSKEAGDFMFGRAKYTIINNGLPVDEYKFSEASRNKYRKEFGANDDTMVIGHVGRFNKQKNHKFLIDVFEEYHKKNQNSILWLVGDGELKEEIKNYIISKKLMNSVKMLGVRKDVNKIYSAMDCFVLPSFFEGMPNTVIEAQAAGLPCLVSDRITRDCSVLDEVGFYDLNYGQDWVNDIRAIPNSKRCVNEEMKKYNISVVVDSLERIFFK